MKPEHEAMEAKSNRELWDNLAKVHVGSTFYDVPGFLEGRTALSAIELEMLGEVRGKSVLHLQCHFGLGTLSLARLGAVATGVDFSGVAIENARRLNKQLGMDALFVECDVNRLEEHLKTEFDLVLASFGVIGWHADLAPWARTVSQFLRPGGRLCFAEFHPVLWMLSDDHTRLLHSYFRTEAIVEENAGSYADPAAGALGTAYCWNHSLGEVFAALESHGLLVRDFKEYDFSPFPCFQDATGTEGRHYIKGHEHKLPLAYSLTACKPEDE